ncbi:methyltransferase domain-containing protein, partial [Sphingobium sp. CCH11-B1]|uniref:methyltransferase domain-containing protein n=1 Tax=Sphingobium sp. CCH11-B1 TaxID=1768781 RepID=UPI0018D254AC
MRTYSDLPNAKILEIGSLNVNGCLRDAAASTTQYTGLDLEEGPSVDHVIDPGADFPVEDDSFDLVMASSVFEHDTRFWDTFVRMCRAARPGGHIYVNAPSNGTVHRYPMDCWRFYPDAGLALAEHARLQGLEIDLVESFIGNRHSDVWNDFVAIFRKGPSAEPLNTAFVYYRYPSLNARTWQSRAVYNESDSTEDMQLINELRQRCDSLSDPEAEGERIAQLEEARGALAAEREKHAALKEEMARLSAALAETEQNGSRAVADNAHLAGQIATLEGNLRERQEEIERAWARANELTDERDAQLEEARGALAAEREKHAALTEEMARLSAALAETEQNGSRAVADNAHLAGQIA